MTIHSRATVTLPQLCGVAAAVIGLSGALGWMLDIDRLRTVLPGLFSMKMNAALTLIASGGALVLRARATRGRLALCLGIFVLLVGAATSLQYVLGRNLGIDELLVHEKSLKEVGGLARGRMAPHTALSFVGVGITLLALRQRWARALVESLALAVMLVGYLAVLGYLYNAPELYAIGPHVAIALHTAAGLLVLGVGLLLVIPGGRLASALVQESPSGLLTRRLLPAAVLGPLLVGGIRALGQEWGLYGEHTGAGIATLGYTLIGVVMLWRSAGALRRIEVKRVVATRTLEGIIAISADAIISIDEQQCMVLYNEGAEQVFGWSREECLGKPIDMLLPERFRGRHRAHLERFLSAHDTARLLGQGRPDLFGLRKNGEEFPAEASISKITGEQRLLTVALRDITERKRVEDLLRHQQVRLAEAQAIAHLGSWEWLLDTNQIIWSDELFRIHGLEPRAFEVTYEAFLARVHEDDRELVDGTLRAACESEAPVTFEHRIRREDGGSRALQVRGVVFRDERGRPYRMAGTAEDITERKAAAELKARLAAIVQASEEAIYSMTPDGIVESWNPAAERLFGYRAAEMLGCPILLLVPGQERARFEEQRQRLQQGQAIESFETRRHTRDGRTLDVSCSMAPIFDDMGRVAACACSVRDVTAQLRAAHSLAASAQEKEVLLKEIHHRVKNNLQVIASLLYLQGRHAIDQGVTDLLLESRDRIYSMALVHDKLYRSHSLASIDFGDYLASLTATLSRGLGVDETRVSIEVVGHDAHFDVEHAMPCALIANELVSNALKHAFPDQRSGSIRVSIARAEAGCFALEVCDDGIGISPDFNPEGASTLGMQLVSSLTEQLRGRLELIREQGTRVRILFPVPQPSIRLAALGAPAMEGGAH